MSKWFLVNIYIYKNEIAKCSNAHSIVDT